MPAHYDGLYPGPDDDDGAPTWLCLHSHRPRGFDWRRSTIDQWVPAGRSDGTAAGPAAANVWIQVRARHPIATDTIYVAPADSAGSGCQSHQPLTPVTYGDILGVITQGCGDPDIVSITDPQIIARAVWATLTQAR